MKRLFAALMASMVLVLLPGSAGAIMYGEVDTEDQYPFVGLLAFYDEAGEYSHRCSGTLVSPTVVLTAAHCTVGTASAFAYFEIEVPADFRENPTGIPGDPDTHPAYNPNTLANDVGVVVLEEAVNLGAYPVLAEEGFLTELKRSHQIKGDTFVAVGYGGHESWPPPVLVFDLLRRFSESPYASLNRNNLHLLQNPNATGTGGTCFGDSGGPHFWEDTLVIVSVTSWGDAICRANDMTQRTDIASVLDFLEDYGITPA